MSKFARSTCCASAAGLTTVFLVLFVLLSKTFTAWPQRRPAKHPLRYCPAADAAASICSPAARVRGVYNRPGCWRLQLLCRHWRPGENRLHWISFNCPRYWLPSWDELANPADKTNAFLLFKLDTSFTKRRLAKQHPRYRRLHPDAARELCVHRPALVFVCKDQHGVRARQGFHQLLPTFQVCLQSPFAAFWVGNETWGQHLRETLWGGSPCG